MKVYSETHITLEEEGEIKQSYVFNLVIKQIVLSVVWKSIDQEDIE